MEQPNRRGVQRVRHELHIRDVEVHRVERLGDAFARIIFRGDALAQFVSASFDDHIKFMFDGPDGQQVRRDFTPLDYDPDARTLTLEFALHEGGAASDWASQAEPGQRAIIGGPRGSMIIPRDYDWHLLAGDRSAMPAIRRRLSELPAGCRVIAVIAAGADRLPLPSQAQVELTWVDDDAGLVDALRALALPKGVGFAWFAGEAATAKRVRALLANEKAVARDAMRVSAYWKHGEAAHHENLE